MGAAATGINRQDCLGRRAVKSQLGCGSGSSSRPTSRLAARSGWHTPSCSMTASIAGIVAGHAGMVGRLRAGRRTGAPDRQSGHTAASGVTGIDTGSFTRWALAHGLPTVACQKRTRAATEARRLKADVRRVELAELHQDAASTVLQRALAPVTSDQDGTMVEIERPGREVCDLMIASAAAIAAAMNRGHEQPRGAVTGVDLVRREPHCGRRGSARESGCGAEGRPTSGHVGRPGESARSGIGPPVQLTVPILPWLDPPPSFAQKPVQAVIWR
jgi:hypothetical protein